MMKTILIVVAGLAGLSYFGTKGFALGRRAWAGAHQYKLVSARDGQAL